MSGTFSSVAGEMDKGEVLRDWGEVIIPAVCFRLLIREPKRNRGMTKKELRDTVLVVRELSKGLGNLPLSSLYHLGQEFILAGSRRIL